MIAGNKPCGKMPPFSKMRRSPGICPETACLVITKKRPIMRNSTRADLDDSEPEIHFTEPFDRDHVHGPDEGKGAKREFIQKFTRIRDEAARRRAVHHQFAQRAKDEEREEAAHKINECEGRAGQLKSRARAAATRACKSSLMPQADRREQGHGARW
jgi:hypothetical protein